MSAHFSEMSKKDISIPLKQLFLDVYIFESIT